MSTTTEPTATQPRLHTIGAVCERLRAEFPDISISKIRYLEDQGLLSPRRTRGGYRLFSEGDVERLETILRLQRDEFLPLRVIRQELAAGRTDESVGAGEAQQRPRRATVAMSGTGSHYWLEEILEERGADRSLVRELEEYGVF
jgi:DNA-binding transcriptional MerR regulator